MEDGGLLVALVVIAGVLTFLARYTGQLLVRMAASLSWLGLGLWLLLGDEMLLDIADPWTQVIGFVFIIMTIVPLTWQVSTEIRTEAKGRSWSDWDRKPKEEPIRRDVVAKGRHRARLRSTVDRHGR